MSPIDESGCASGVGEGKKGKEGSLGWGIQALLFSHFKHCVLCKLYIEITL